MIRRVVGAAAGLCLIAALGACGTPLGNDANEANAVEASAGPRHFVNSRDNATSPNLREHYVDFSFDYPGSWTVTPQGPAGQNYVRVAAPMVNGYEPFAFHVGTAWGTGDPRRDRSMMESGTRDLAERIGSSFQNYRIVSTGAARVGGYASYGWRFTATAPGVNGEPPVQVFGRGDIILPPGQARGVLLITLATSRTSEVTRAEDLGEGGTIKALFDSFRLTGIEGSPAPAAAPAAPPPEVRPAEPATLAPARPTTPAPRPATPPPAAAPAPAAPAPAPVTPPPPATTAPPPQPAPSPPAGNGQ